MSAATNESTLPALSAIVVIPDVFKTVARTVSKLQAQTAVARIELVLVHPPEARGTIPFDALSKFHSVQICELPEVTFAPAMAEGTRAAHAPIVAFTEDHAFPAPNWAERLLAAHDQPLAPGARPIAVVGPAMRCANPDSLISLTDFYIGYSKWAAPISSGEQDYLMGHNASYKRALLMEYNAHLPELLDAETVLQFDLAKRGYRFWLEATTYTEHFNFEKPTFWVGYLIYFGRVFAGTRSASWSLFKRVAYTVMSPLIPVLRFVRVRRGMQRANFPAAKRLKLYALLIMGLLLDALGQFLGYLFGPGNRTEEQLALEFHRERYISHPAAVLAE